MTLVQQIADELAKEPSNEDRQKCFDEAEDEHKKGADYNKALVFAYARIKAPRIAEIVKTHYGIADA